MVFRRSILFRGLLLAGASFVLTGQQFSDRYEPLIRVLSLTDAQITQLQQASGDQPRASLLDATQQYQLAEIAKDLQRFGISAAAVVMGLMDVAEWPTGWPCPISYGSARVYAKEFDLTAEQVQRFEQLQQNVQQRAVDQLMEIGNRYAKMLPGERLPPKEWAAVREETAKWVKQRDEALPPRNLAMAVLNETQKAKLAAFRANLELAREALDLHLIRLPGMPEIFCH